MDTRSAQQDKVKGGTLPLSAHTSRPWRIHEIAADFRLLDVWALPTVGARGDFSRLVELMAKLAPSDSSSMVARILFAARQQLGDLLGWDHPDSGIGGRVASLRHRLPADLRMARPPEFEALPASPLYLTQDEFAAEVANQTVHGVVHLSWVQGDPDKYRGQMAILVKPNGLLGRAYLASIMPFRHLLVYPALMRDIESMWHTASAEEGA